MEVKRYMILHENGNISFQKITIINGEIEVTTYAEYDERIQTELDFAQECQKRFENEFPNFEGLLVWEMICEDDLTAEIETAQAAQQAEILKKIWES